MYTGISALCLKADLHFYIYTTHDNVITLTMLFAFYTMN